MFIKPSKQKLLEAQIAESARVVTARIQHEATWPQVKAQFDEDDAEAIKLATRYSAEMTAGSPRANATAIELKAVRWRRDGRKGNFSRKHTEFANQNAAIVEPVIREFIEFCHSLAKQTLTLRHVVTDRVIPFVDMTKTYRVRHNEGKLSELRERILQALADVRTMTDKPLADVLDRIEKYKAEFQAFDTEEMEAVELNQMAYGDLTAREETPKYSSGVMTNSGFLPIGLTKEEHLQHKIDQLKADPIFRRPQ